MPCFKFIIYNYLKTLIFNLIYIHVSVFKLYLTLSKYKYPSFNLIDFFSTINYFNVEIGSTVPFLDDIIYL
jgi:glyoxylate carboligase